MSNNIQESAKISKKQFIIDKQVERISKIDNYKRILELHFNLLCSVGYKLKKMVKEGFIDLQQEILMDYTNDTFEKLMFFIETKFEFKKIVKLICLINFSNSGFTKSEYDKIIWAVIKNYHIQCFDLLLKMDTHGYFSKKEDIFQLKDIGIDKIKSELFQNQYFFNNTKSALIDKSNSFINPILDESLKEDFNKLQSKVINLILEIS